MRVSDGELSDWCVAAQKTVYPDAPVYDLALDLRDARARIAELEAERDELSQKWDALQVRWCRQFYKNTALEAQLARQAPVIEAARLCINLEESVQHHNCTEGTDSSCSVCDAFIRLAGEIHTLDGKGE